MEPQACPVTWPLDPGQGDLIAPAILAQLPGHACTLDADHIHEVLEQRFDEQGVPQPWARPHRCHCGTWLPVRDVEPAPVDAEPQL